MDTKSNAETDIKQALGLGASSGKKIILKRVALWGSVVVIAIIVLFITGLRGRPEPVQFLTKKVEQGDLTKTVGATGNLEPRNEVEVGSELSGNIETVEVDYNDHVKVGQILARLDTEKLDAEVNNSKAALESARAGVMQAEATLKETKAEYERYKHVYELSGGKVPSAYDLESAQAEYAKAQADLASAKAQSSQARATLDSDETDLSKAIIRSPINGVVLTREVEPGQTVAASLEAPVLFTLAEDLSRMELHVDVDEADVGQVKQGQEATFTVDAYPDRVFPAHITQVRYGATDTDGVITYETVLQVDNDDLLLRPGMTATADIVVSKVEHAVLVPNAALRFSPPMPSQGPATGKEKNEARGGILSKLMPRPPRHEKSASANHTPERETNGKQEIWILQDGHPVPVRVITGMTDGIMTEITEGNLKPGMDVLVGTASEKK